MATSTTVRGVGVKLRHPWGVFLLTLVTLGIYYLYWYYKINRELRDFGRTTGQQPNPIKVDPVMAVLAISIGAILVVPPFVSWYRTFGRIETAEELAGIRDTISPGLGFLLFLVAFFFLPFEGVYAQGHLNKLWQHELERESSGPA